MSASANPDIVEDHLIFHIDAKHPRCYTSGSTCTDLIQGVDGSLAGDTSVTSEGFTFASDGDWIFFDDHDGELLTQNISVFAWANKTATNSNTDTLIRTRYGNEETYALMINANNRIRWESWVQESDNRQDVDYTVGTFSDWNYFGIVLQSTGSNSHTMKFYFNGELVNSQAFNYTIRTSSQGIYIGGGPNNALTPIHQLNGSIMSASIYDKVLSEAEVLQNFNAIKSRFGL